MKNGLEGEFKTFFVGSLGGGGEVGYVAEKVLFSFAPPCGSLSFFPERFQYLIQSRSLIGPYLNRCRPLSSS